MRLIVFAGVLLASIAAAQPSLQPPAGAVSASQRFGLGTAINATNTPGDANAVFRITEPGPYYLAQDITITDLTTIPGKAVAIEVAADNVTIDLNGFTIERVLFENPIGANEPEGGRGTPTTPDENIAISTEESGAEGLRVRNGYIRGFAYGIRTEFFFAADGDHGTIEHLEIETTATDQVGGAGILCQGDWTIRDCRVRSEGSGIVLGGSALASGSQIYRTVVIADGNGIDVDNGIVQDCSVTSGNIGIDSGGGMVRGCNVVAAFTGIRANFGLVENSRARVLTGSGINAAIEVSDGVISNCRANAPSGIPAYIVKNQTVVMNCFGSGNSDVSNGAQVLNSNL